MPTFTQKMASTNELQRKLRVKRRLLRTLSTSRKQKVKEEDAATDSDDSEVEVRKADRRKEFFTTKRMMDQSHEGRLRKQSMKELASATSRLLPLTEAEIEPEDEYVTFGRFLKREDSSSTLNSNKTQDSAMARLSETNESTQRPVVIEQFSTIFARDDNFEIFTADDGDDSSIGKKKESKNLYVRFADEHGQELERVHWTITMYSEEENDWVRAIVLLLSPRKKKFEFLHISYNVYDKNTVGDVLDQLPDIATDESLKSQKYVGLVRKEGGRELINTVSIQSYCLKKNEILVAVVDGHYGKAMLRMAKPLLDNKKIMKTVTKSKSRKITVKQLKPLPAANSNKTFSRDTGKVYPVHGSKDPSSVRPTQPEHDTAESLPDRRSLVRLGSEGELYGSSAMTELNACFDDDDVMNANYLNDDDNKDKVTLTRFLNAGIITALVFGLQRRLLRHKRG